MILRARKFEITFPRPALMMGIVNVTPDSFSDGGRFLNAERAIQHALELIEQGAEIIDIGGESSRPSATPVTEKEEMERVLPVIEGLAGKVSVPISIDTVKPAVARAAVAVGASIINDIGANRTDPAMWKLVAETGVAYVLMHMQGTPETMQANPTYANVVDEVQRFFQERLNLITSAGVDQDQIVLDVGIGFGKSLEHNLQLLRGLGTFKKWERPLLLGVSRKSFISKLLGATAAERLPASIACECWGVQQGANVVRTHEVAASLQAVRMTENLQSHGPLGNFKS